MFLICLLFLPLFLRARIATMLNMKLNGGEVPFVFHFLYNLFVNSRLVCALQWYQTASRRNVGFHRLISGVPQANFICN